MEHFADKLLEKKYNYSKELLKIEELLKKDGIYSINSTVNSNIPEWKKRNTCLTLQELRSEKQIDKIIVLANNVFLNPNIECEFLDYFIYYCEFVINIINIPNVFNSCINYASIIVNNIKTILDSINKQINNIDGCYYIIEKDAILREAVEVVQEKYNLGEDLFLYRHQSNSGNLIKKADILSRLYKYFETYLEKQLKSNNLSKLASDIGYISDKMDIRHAPKGKEIILLNNMSAIEQEKWYDTAFSLYLYAIVLKPYINKEVSIDELKQKLGNT